MPKVTLLAEPWQNYTVPMGKRIFTFEGQKARDVPTAVALFCANKKDEKGKKIFKVTGLNNIVTPASPAPKQNVEKETPVLGNSNHLRLIEAELCH